MAIEEAVYRPGATGQEYAGYPVINNINGAAKVAIINGRADVTPETLKQGFKWLGHWEIIAPFRSYRDLASDYLQRPEDVEKAGIGDPRVPVFDTRLLFIKHGARSKQVMKRFETLKSEWPEVIAFYIAVWEIKPYIKPLPPGVVLSARKADRY